MKPAEFLEPYRWILFDLDGVLTAERSYWNCAALAVYEMLHSRQFFGEDTLDLDWMHREAASISSRLFLQDKTITLLKNLGVNSNWDLAYLLLAGLAAWKQPEAAYEYYEKKKLSAPEIYQDAQQLLERVFPQGDCERQGLLYRRLQTLFDEWYYGTELFQKVGRTPLGGMRKGVMEQETPLHSLEKTQWLLKGLKDSGKRLGIATGRPRLEYEMPFSRWEILSYFEQEHCVSYDEVTTAQNSLGKTYFLAKPAPFSFLKAAFGTKYDDRSLALGQYDPQPLKQVLIVGDAGADILAAKAMHTDFAAVLTGVNGQQARAYFEKEGATYICDSVLDLMVE